MHTERANESLVFCIFHQFRYAPSVLHSHPTRLCLFPNEFLVSWQIYCWTTLLTADHCFPGSAASSGTFLCESHTLSSVRRNQHVRSSNHRDSRRPTIFLSSPFSHASCYNKYVGRINPPPTWYRRYLACRKGLASLAQLWKLYGMEVCWKQIFMCRTCALFISAFTAKHQWPFVTYYCTKLLCIDVPKHRIPSPDLASQHMLVVNISASLTGGLAVDFRRSLDVAPFDKKQTQLILTEEIPEYGSA